MHYIVFCGKQNILLRGHPNEKVIMNQATVSRLSSASDSPGIVLFDKEAGSPGNSIALLMFQAQADDAALLRNFHCNTYYRRVAGMRTTSSRHHTWRPDFFFLAWPKLSVWER